MAANFLIRRARQYQAGLLVVLTLVMVLLVVRFSVVATQPRSQDLCAARGALGTPKTFSATGVSIGLWGWAFDRDGIREIQAIADGKVIARSRLIEMDEAVRAALPECRVRGKTRFAFTVPSGPSPVAERRIEVRAVTSLGRSYVVGETTIRFDRPVAYVNPGPPIRWDGENRIDGWAISGTGPLSVRLLAGERELAHSKVDRPHWQLGKLFPEWPAARTGGFEMHVTMAGLPPGNYSTKVRIEDGSGAFVELPGPNVENDHVVGMVRTAEDRWTANRDVALSVWLPSGIRGGVALEASPDKVLATLRQVRANVPLSEFEHAPTATRSPSPLGTTYEATVSLHDLPPGVHRIGIAANGSFLPGPLARAAAASSTPCPGTVRRMYYPGNGKIFRAGFREMRSWRAMVAAGCIEVGIRGRVEYLRTTRGREFDYQFDPDFPESALERGGRQMTGVPLRQLLDLALRLHAPLLITLDGGVWADSAFPAPDIDVVDMLEEDDRNVQWNQFGRAEPDDALKNLAASFNDPELARMMSLNRFNTRFLAYKKRNLQMAIREILAFTQAHPEIDVAINLDPDEYINPWFFQRQWYDYNPDTLRQFREWLFHRGPYANGQPLAGKRFTPGMTLDSASRLAGTRFASESEVEPPRRAIDYGSQWLQIWEHFKKHLVAQHYDDLARWATEAGFPAAHIFTSQTFILADVANRVGERSANWTDQAGVSIEGAKPRYGHLGAILYGEASRNSGKPRSGLSLLDNIRAVDPDWGTVELHPAVIDRPDVVPDHTDAYRTLLATFNAGTTFVSPMWGSRLADRVLHPEKFRSYDSMEGSPFEYQLAWWLIELQKYPRGTRHFPFGNDLVESLDGWSADVGTRASLGRGMVHLEGTDAVGLASPVWNDPGATCLTLRVAGTWPGAELRAEWVSKSGNRQPCLGTGGTMSCTERSPEGASGRIRLSWRSVGEPALSVSLDSVTVSSGCQ